MSVSAKFTTDSALFMSVSTDIAEKKDTPSGQWDVPSPSPWSPFSSPRVVITEDYPLFDFIHMFIATLNQ